MRVLGIDPGTRFLGFGVVEERAGRLVHIGHGVVKTDAEAPLELRLKQIFGELSAVCALYRPAAVAVEGVFHHRNARSALVLGHARGVALLVAAQFGVAVSEYPPARVKKSVGAGGADGKDAVARMVQTFLRLPEVERADASDALAVAICHLNQLKFRPAAGGTARGVARAPRKGKAAMLSLASRLRPAYVRAVSEK